MADKRTIKALENKKPGLMHKLQSMDDVLPGSLVSSYLPCNKGNCRCTRGELHGPTWRLTWKEKGKSQILYIRRAELAHVKKATKRYGEARKLLARIAFLNLEILKAKR
ncbi:MAG: DUF6788 family protein [Acidobacteriota bacterium]